MKKNNTYTLFQISPKAQKAKFDYKENEFEIESHRGKSAVCLKKLTFFNIKTQLTDVSFKSYR
jgi:uncharacterized protein YxjI